MTEAESQPASKPRLRCYRITPDRVVIVLLAVECVLWLSDRLHCPAWHKGYAVLTGMATVGLAMAAVLVWFAGAFVCRWQFQFSIRSLLLLVVVVALPCSWFATEMKRARCQDEAAREIGRLDGWVAYFYDANDPWSVLQAPAPNWLSGLLGNDFFGDVVYANMRGIGGEITRLQAFPRLKTLCLSRGSVVDADIASMTRLSSLRHLDLSHSTVTDASLEPLKSLAQIRDLDLWYIRMTDERLKNVGSLTQLTRLNLDVTGIIDDDLEHLKRLTHLQELRVGGTRITDRGLKQIATLPHLQRLNLAFTDISDAGVEDLMALNELRELNLAGTYVSDKGLEALAGFKGLRKLSLDPIRISDEAMKKLQQALPNCAIEGR